MNEKIKKIIPYAITGIVLFCIGFFIRSPTIGKLRESEQRYKEYTNGLFSGVQYLEGSIPEIITNIDSIKEQQQRDRESINSLARDVSVLESNNNKITELSGNQRSTIDALIGTSGEIQASGDRLEKLIRKAAERISGTADTP